MRCEICGKDTSTNNGVCSRCSKGYQKNYFPLIIIVLLGAGLIGATVFGILNFIRSQPAPTQQSGGYNPVNECKFNQKMLESAIQMYESQKGTEPVTQSDLISAGMLKAPLACPKKMEINSYTWDSDGRVKCNVDPSHNF